MTVFKYLHILQRLILKSEILFNSKFKNNRPMIINCPRHIYPICLSVHISDSSLLLPGFQILHTYHVTELSRKTRGDRKHFYMHEGWCTDMTDLNLCKLFHSPWDHHLCWSMFTLCSRSVFKMHCRSWLKRSQIYLLIN